MRPLALLRRFIEWMLPWYDPAEAEHRRHETERVRRRSIAARVALEDVPRRYDRQDERLGR